MRKRRYTDSTSYEFSECQDNITVPVDNSDILKDWRRVLSDWENFAEKNYDKARVLVRRGVPPEIRGEAWKRMSGAQELRDKNPGVFEILARQNSEAEDSLEKDVHRTFPKNNMFKLKEGTGQKALYNVLKAYSLMDREVGYCQGMSYLTGILVTNLNETDAFWVLVSLLKGNYNLRGLFLHNLPLLKHYLFRFQMLIAAYMPDLAQHLDNQGVKPLFYCAEWFSTLYSYNVPHDVTSRIWDVYLLEGHEYLFRIGLAILKVSQEDIMDHSFDGIMVYMKQKVSLLDVSILAVADKFNGISETIEKIDQKWESMKAKILGTGEEDFKEKNDNNVTPHMHITPQTPKWDDEQEEEPPPPETLGRKLGSGRVTVIKRGEDDKF